MTRVPSFDNAQPVLATVVPPPDEAYVAQLECDNDALGRKLQCGERELAQLRREVEQLRQAVGRASTAGGAALALAELHRQRDGLLAKASAAEQERDVLRVRVLDLERMCRQYRSDIEGLIMSYQEHAIDDDDAEGSDGECPCHGQRVLAPR